MKTEICDCKEAPEFQSTTWGGPVCSRCGKKMILSRQVAEIRKVIDQFELWKCGDDADGYNVSADHLAGRLANTPPGIRTMTLRADVEKAVHTYLGAMKDAHAREETGGEGYREKGSYFSTLDNLADYLAATLVLDGSSASASVSLIEGMSDEEFARDKSGENPNAGEMAPAKDAQVAGKRGPCIPVAYCGLATSTHVPLGSDEDHCDLCGHPAQPFAASAPDNQPEAWAPPPAASRPDGYECLIWHRGRWRHVRWVAPHQGWMFGYGSAHTRDAHDRLYAPLPAGAPENDFWQGEKS